MSIRLIVDSASDISMMEASKLGITMIPMQIRFGDEEFFDGVDLLPNVFYDKLAASEALPQTSQINPYRFEEIFNKELEEYMNKKPETMGNKILDLFYKYYYYALIPIALLFIYYSIRLALIRRRKKKNEEQ